jgi:hypothetical protein
MRYLSFFIISILISSCATIFNRKTQNVVIQTDSKQTILINDLDTLKNEREYKVRFLRGYNPIKISILDTLNQKKDYSIKPTFSTTLLFNIWNYGAGYFIDYLSPKRFGYPNYVYLKESKSKKNNNQQTYKYYTFQKTYKNDLFIGFSIPLFNNFTNSNILNQSISTANALGISLFVDYYYLKNTFFSIKASQQNVLYGIEDSYYTYSDEINKILYHSYEKKIAKDNIIDAASSSITITHNHQLRNIQFNYGLGLTRYNYTRYLELYLSSIPTYFIYHENQTNIDLVLSTYYLIGKHVNIGVIYRPSFFSLTNNSNEIMNNFFGIDLMFRFKKHKKFNFTNENK